MTHVPVASSSIASAAYQAAEMVLEVRFQNGALYQYRDVPEGIYTGLLGAESKGRYFNEVVRDRFAYRRA